MEALTEDKIKEIIKEEIQKYFSEGIDIPKRRTVSVTNSHQNFVDTNDHNHPYLFTDKQRGYNSYQNQ